MGKPAGFLRHDGKMLDLNSLVAARGTLYIEVAMEINNRGQIAATARDLETGKRSAVLLNPPGL